jgi:Popeye protein conserved region
MVVFIHAANAIYLCSYLVKDILWLRVLTVAGGMVLLLYYAVMPRPIWSAIVWNVLFAAINLRQIRLLLLERRPVTLRPDEMLLYRLAFRRLTEREFAKLLSVGQWRNVRAGECVVHRGEALQQLIVVASGRLRVEVDEKTTAELRPGCLVGEMSFLTGKLPNADVYAVEPTRTVSWQAEVLRKLLDTNLELRASVQQVIGEDLIAKLQPV